MPFRPGQSGNPHGRQEGHEIERALLCVSGPRGSWKTRRCKRVTCRAAHREHQNRCHRQSARENRYREDSRRAFKDVIVNDGSAAEAIRSSCQR